MNLQDHALTAGMTIFEALAVFLYIGYIHANSGGGGVYSTAAVLGGGILFVGLMIETYIVFREVSWLTAGLAFTEVVVWSQWANMVTLGMWSRRGIGPAFVVLAALLVLQHGVETKKLTERENPLTLRHIVTAGVEALAATVGWVLYTGGEVIPAVIAIIVILYVEHAIRISDIG